MGTAKRDDNYVPTLIAVSNADGTTPITLYADPTTHRLLVSATMGALNDLSDVTITSAEQGDILYYSGATNGWVNLVHGTAGQYLKTGGHGANPSWDTPTASAAGSDTQVQFNDGGTALGGDAGLTYNKTTDTLNVDHIAEVTATHGVAIDGVTLKDGGALVITGGTNTFNLTNGTAVLDIAASSTLNVDANLTVEAVSLINQDLTTDANAQFATVTLNNTGLHLLDTNASHDLIIAPGSDLTADHTLTVTTGDADRTLTLSGNLTVESASLINQDLTTDSATAQLGTLTLGNTGLHVLDTNASHDLIIKPGSDITADRTLTITTGDADRTITLANNFTTAGNFALTLTQTGATDVTLPTTGTLATLAGTEELDNKTLDSSVGKGTWTASGTWILPAFTAGGNITLAENSSIALDPAGSADGKYTGITVSGTAGATLAFGDLCYLAAADSRWELADADAAATSGDVLLGMCVLAAANDGDATVMLLMGIIRADTAFPALTVSAQVYVSTTAGDIQVAQPTGTDDVIRVVGRALTADEIFFNPSNDYITHT